MPLKQQQLALPLHSPHAELLAPLQTLTALNALDLLFDFACMVKFPSN